MRFAIDTHIAQRRIVRPFLRFVNTVPIDPTNPFGARVLARALAAGDKVCIFPEGRITVTGGLMPITGGPGMLADTATCPVVTNIIEGAESRLLSSLRGRRPPRLVTGDTLPLLTTPPPP